MLQLEVLEAAVLEHAGLAAMPQVMRGMSKMAGRIFGWAVLTLTSVMAAGYAANAADQLPVAPPAEAIDGKSVDMLSGQLLLRDPGVSIGSEGSGQLVFVRTWAGTGAMVFLGWNNNLNYNIRVRPGSASVSLGDRSEGFMGSFAAYTAVKPTGSSLVYVNDDFIYTDRDGTVVVFSRIWISPTQAIGWFAKSLAKPDGERWVFTYGTWSSSNSGTQAFLKSVQTNFGYQIKFGYSPSSSVINSAVAINDAVEYCDPSASACSGLVNPWPLVTYSRSAIAANSNYTETVLDADSKTRSFVIWAGTDTIGRPWPAKIISKTEGGAGNPSTNYTYDTVSSGTTSSGVAYTVVKSVSDVSGYWSYSYDLSDVNVFKVTSISPDQSQRTFKATSPNFIQAITSVEDELSRLTTFVYNNDRQLTDVVWPEGEMSGASPVAGYTHHEYDGRGNVVSVARVAKSGSGLANIVYSAGYDASCGSPAKCNKPNWVRDELGGQTDYTYDATHGGVLSEMRPAPSVGAARPLTLISWAPIHGWVKNAAGALVQSSYPIWRVAAKTVCQTAVGSNTPACDANAQQTVTTFQYGGAGTRYALLVKGMAVSSGGTTLRTCYDYDIYGRAISETAPRAGLGVCP